MSAKILIIKNIILFAVSQNAMAARPNWGGRKASFKSSEINHRAEIYIEAYTITAEARACCASCWQKLRFTKRRSPQKKAHFQAPKKEGSAVVLSDPGPKDSGLDSENKSGNECYGVVFQLFQGGTEFCEKI